VIIRDKLARLDWKAIEASLWQQGYAKTDSLLTAEQCDALVGLYGKDQLSTNTSPIRYRRWSRPCVNTSIPA
jgi:hypothetical protein